MTLRRPTLFFCLLTIVLGITYEISRPSFPLGRVRESSTAVREKSHAASDPEIHTSSERSAGTEEEESPEEKMCWDDGSPCRDEGHHCLRGDIRGLLLPTGLSLQPGDQCHGDSSEKTGWTAATRLNPCCQLSEHHVVTDAPSIHRSQPQRVSGECAPCSSPQLQELGNKETCPFWKVQQLEVEDACLLVSKRRDLHNRSRLAVWKNCEKRLGKETTSERKHEVSLLCLCLTLLFFRNEDLKQKVVAPLLRTFKQTTSISDLVKRFVERLTGTTGSEGSGFHHDLDRASTNGPVNEPKKNPAYSLPNFGHVPFILPKRRQSLPELAAEKGSFGPSRRRTDLESFIPRRPVTYTIFPAGFLPSLGASAKDSMSFLGGRLASLFSLPSSCKVSRTRLAETGFYYDVSKTSRDASNVHEVSCYSCGVSYSQWKEGDNPELIHQWLKPDCPHLKEKSSSSGTSNTQTPLPPFPNLEGIGPSLGSVSMSEGRSTSLASSNASSGYGSMSGGSLGSSSSMSSDVSDSAAGSFPSAQSDHMRLMAPMTGGRPGPQAAAATTTVRDGQSSGPRLNSAMNRNNVGDLATDCAAIFPSDVASSAPVANQVSSRQPARDAILTTTTTTTAAAAAAAQSANRSALPGSGAPPANGGLGRRGLEDRPPLSMSEAVYPQFSKMQDRRATFVEWPLSHVFHPDHLVMQGFYYAGYADCIRCFYCGVGLKTWSEDDDVMVEHIRWRPSCGYILNTKGQHFVKSIQQQFIKASTSGQHKNSSNGQRQGGTATTTATNGTRETAVNQTASFTTTTTITGPTTAVASGTGSSGRNVATAASKEVLTTVQNMGFDSNTVARALLQLQREDVRNIGVEELVGKICELDTDGGDERTEEDDGDSGFASASTDINTDGPEESSAQTRAARATEAERAQQLADENQRLRDRNLCKLCKGAKVGMIYMPCGHILACTQCGAKARNCSKCGEFIRATANVYI